MPVILSLFLKCLPFKPISQIPHDTQQWRDSSLFSHQLASFPPTAFLMLTASLAKHSKQIKEIFWMQCFALRIPSPFSNTSRVTRWITLIIFCTWKSAHGPHSLFPRKHQSLTLPRIPYAGSSESVWCCYVQEKCVQLNNLFINNVTFSIKC